MSSWNRWYRIAGLRLAIKSDVGDPTPYLPGAMSAFSLPLDIEHDAQPGERLGEEGEIEITGVPLRAPGSEPPPSSPDLAVILYEDEEAHADPLRRFSPPRFALLREREDLVFAAVPGGSGACPRYEGGRERAPVKPLGLVQETGSGRMGMPPLDRSWRIPEEEEAVREALQAFVKACLQLRLLHSGGTMAHAAGVSIGGEGFLLTGHTRTGKTTLSRQFPRESVLGDDLVAVREERGAFFLYGTPWPGREGGAVCYGGLPLRAAFLLHPELPRGLRRRRPGDSLAELSANAPRLGHPGEESNLLDIFSRLLEKVPIYELSLGLGDDAIAFFERVSAREEKEEEGGDDGPPGS